MGTELVVLSICIVFCIIIFKAFESRSTRDPTVQDDAENDPINLSPKLTESYLNLKNYTGQTKLVKYIRGHINKAKKTGKPLPHMVLSGSGGLGKSTLVKAIANEMGGQFVEATPALLKSSKDMFDLLFVKKCPMCGHPNPYTINRCQKCRASLVLYYNPQPKLLTNDILFLEECHGLRVDIEEALYSLMQDGYIIMRYNGLDQQVIYPDITIAGATTRLGDLRKPFRDRFKINLQLEPYTHEEMVVIINQYCNNKEIDCDPSGADYIASLSYGVPRIAKSFIEDATTVSSKVSKNAVHKICNLKDIDENGLHNVHREILMYIHVRGQAGASAIATSVGITVSIYLEVYEPALLYKRLIWQGSRGRMLTLKAVNMYFPNCKCDKCNKIRSS